MKYIIRLFFIYTFLTFFCFSQPGSPDSVNIKWNETIGSTRVDLPRSLEEESLIPVSYTHLTLPTTPYV